MRGLLVFVYGGVHGRLWKKMKHGMELCVASNHKEASGLLIALIVSLKSTVGFVSKFDQF